MVLYLYCVYVGFVLCCVCVAFCIARSFNLPVVALLCCCFVVFVLRLSCDLLLYLCCVMVVFLLCLLRCVCVALMLEGISPCALVYWPVAPMCVCVCLCMSVFVYVCV